VWIAPGASLRYYMSLFPCFACLIGILIEARMTLPTREVWAAFVCWYQRALAVLILAAGVGVAALSWLRPQSDFSQSVQFAAPYFAACLSVAAWIWWFSARMTPRALMLSFTATACFLGMSQATLMVNIRQRFSEDAGQAVALKTIRPFGTTPSTFACGSKGPIRRSWISRGSQWLRSAATAIAAAVPPKSPSWDAASFPPRSPGGLRKHDVSNDLFNQAAIDARASFA
jgi:hypothetical protein